MKTSVLQALVLLMLSAGATFLTWKFNPNVPAFNLNEDPVGEGEVSIEKALEWESEGGVIWLDARDGEEYEKAHISGAILLNEFEFKSQIAESYYKIASQDEPIVVYCGSRSCKASTTIADQLREMRINDVYVLKGGWDAWREATGK